VLVLTNTHFISRMISGLVVPGATGMAAEMERINVFLSKYQRFLYLLLIPISALVMKWIFPKSGLNYSEHLVGYVIYYSNSMLTHILIMLLAMLVSDNFNTLMSVSTIVTSVMMVVFIHQFYQVSWLKSVFRTVLYLLIFISMAAVFSLLIGLAGFIK
jgi:hypothetical protein